MAHLAPIGEIPARLILHLRNRHYLAIIGKNCDRYIVGDPDLGGQSN
jgi:hypothetical protein